MNGVLVVRRMNKVCTRMIAPIIVIVLSLFLGSSVNGDSKIVLPGGRTTVFSESEEAFTLPASNLIDEERRLRFFIGKKLFNTEWQRQTNQPATAVRLMHGKHAASCAACHIRNGRGDSPSLQGKSARGVSIIVVHNGQEYRAQFGNENDRNGLRVSLEFALINGRYPDGTEYQVRRPKYQVWKGENF